MTNSSNFIFKDLPKNKIDLYNDNGYLSLGKTLTDNGLQLVLDDAMREWRKEKGEFREDNSWLQNSLLVNIHRRSDIIRDFYYRGPILHVARQIIGPNIKGATSQLTFKMRGNTKSFGWHQDNGYGELDPYNTITSLTALEKVDEDNGCLRLIPESHKRGQLPIPKRDRENLEQIELDMDDKDAIPLPMEPGETVIFNCWMLHYSRGNFSKERDRRILFLRYADADAVEVYNNGKPRLGKLLSGKTRFREVEKFESEFL